jgi:hypothetical protein
VIASHFERIGLIAACVLLGVSLVKIAPCTSWAFAEITDKAAPVSPGNESKPAEQRHKTIEAEWGGHIKVRGSVSWPDDESVYQLVGTGTLYDGSAEGRLKNKVFFGNWGYFETHYEVVLLGGDTWEKERELERLLPDLFNDSLLFNAPVEDDRRVLDLTTTIDQTDHHILYHRLDRLSLSLLPKWGVVRIGRQAVTWGNGFLFNPMDLVNPFLPTDIEREYKVGDDMVYVQLPLERTGDLQFLYVPRRDPSSGDVEWSQSSLAGKLHVASGTTEFDVMAAKHSKDDVAGLGSTGYLGDATWRLNIAWTFVDKDSDLDDYLSLVANMDYSWVWWGKNFYGFAEFFYNGLGSESYTEAFADPEVLERLARGQVSTLGRTYLGGHIRVELHPLFNVFFTVINNTADPSGVLQPRATWDISQNCQVTFGGNIYYGATGTEYGGFRIQGTNFLAEPADSAFLWLTFFF